MIPSEIVEKNRRHFRAEGAAAFRAGTLLENCPYSLGGPDDPAFGFKPAVEWCNGWKEAERGPNQPVELVTWEPPIVTLRGAPITPELQMVFGHLTGGTVRGLALGDDGIHVQYEDGTELIWSPRPASGPMPFGALFNV